jgi:hypothetical protein
VNALSRFRFENPPAENPSPLVYYRRLVYQMALERLATIAAAVQNFLSGSATGKALRAVAEPGKPEHHGDVIGRGKGLMPSLVKEFPETAGFEPRKLLRTIQLAKSPAYFELLAAAIEQVQHGGRHGPEQLELWVRDATRRELDSLPPVVYPAHRGRRSCRHCKRPHSAMLHRFHMGGAFEQTHIGPAKAAARKRERAEQTERMKDEVPF